MEVSYSSPAFQQATGYAVGQHFAPGEVQIKVALDKQMGGEGLLHITQVVNTAETVMAYRPWDTAGVQSGEADRKTQTQTANVRSYFDELQTAMMGISCVVDKKTISLNGEVVTYTITLTNSETADAAMINPFLVDLLPQEMCIRDSPGAARVGPQAE